MLSIDTGYESFHVGWVKNFHAYIFGGLRGRVGQLSKLIRQSFNRLNGFRS